MSQLGVFMYDIYRQYHGLKVFLSKIQVDIKLSDIFGKMKWSEKISFIYGCVKFRYKNCEIA